MELLDVVNEDNKLTGEIQDKEIIHKNGIWHREVAIWIMNESGEVLLQKRSANKKHKPNKWGLTAGHIGTGEIPEDAIKREIQEEIGVSINDFKQICIQKISEENLSKGQNNYYFSYIFFANVNYKINEYTIQKEELSELKYITLEELEDILRNKDDNYTFSKKKHMLDILKYLYKERGKLNA